LSSISLRRNQCAAYINAGRDTSETLERSVTELGAQSNAQLNVVGILMVLD